MMKYFGIMQQIMMINGVSMTNYFKQLNPWSTICYMILLFFTIITADHGLNMMVVFLSISLNFSFILGMISYLQTMKSGVFLIFFMGIFNMLFNHRGETPILYINNHPLTVEAFLYGINMGIMIISLLLGFRIFNMIFDNQKITYIIGRRFPVTGLIISMVFCYYEKFIRKIDKIKEVWSTYGTEEKFGKLKNAGIIWSVLLSVMLEDSVETAMSMSARGYGKGKRSSYIQYAFKSADYILLFIILVYGTGYIIAGYHAVWMIAAYFFVPDIYNIYKELQWKYYLSKI